MEYTPHYNLTSFMKDLKTIVNYSKSKGFIFPSSEIYGGFSAIYDFGPLGTELKNNVKHLWWKEMVWENKNVVGLDSSIFMHPKIWEASGHVSGFSDPLVECQSCNTRIRVDHALEDQGVEADDKMTQEEITQLFEKHKAQITCPECKASSFTSPRQFNLLVKSNLGNFTEDMNKSPVYLRGETCQGIYVNFLNVLNSMRVKVPFGIAQIGKAFRNEVTARQFVFRTREFEQMEFQYFTHPKDDIEEYEKLKKERWNFWIKMGLSEKNLQWKRHPKLAFYAKDAYDIEYNYPIGWKELEGVHARGNYDLSQHDKFSEAKITYTDPVTKETFTPHVAEASSGVERAVFAILCEAYTHEELDNGESRIVMKFNKQLAPIKVAVLPLLSSNSDLVKKANEIFDTLRSKFMCQFDVTGSIGKRYRRQDEIGTPLCITIDFDTLKDNTVTIRDRDSMKQQRISVDKLESLLREELS